MNTTNQKTDSKISCSKTGIMTFKAIVDDTTYLSFFNRAIDKCHELRRHGTSFNSYLKTINSIKLACYNTVYQKRLKATSVYYLLKLDFEKSYITLSMGIPLSNKEMNYKIGKADGDTSKWDYFTSETLYVSNTETGKSRTYAYIDN